MSRRVLPPVLAALAVVTVCGAVTACSEADDLTQDDIPFETPTLPPTTVLHVPFLDVLGLEYCEVATQVAPSIQVFTDEGADFGDAGVVQDTYVKALVAFDALEQVSTREIEDDVGLLTRTMSEAVYAASAAGWDITKVTDDAAEGVSSDEVNAALLHLRQYTLERCTIDLLDIEPPVTTSLYESPTQRLLRVLAFTFPSLSEESLLCLGARLPVEWDPDNPDLDENVVLQAMARCGIDPNAPSTPTTSATEPPEDD